MEYQDEMLRAELTCGQVEYEDTGGDKPTLVFLHGLVMNGSVWRKVVANLRDEFRCIVPTLPLGGHRLPVNPQFELSPRSVAMLIGELLELLDLNDVTLVENDAGRAQTFAATRPARVARLVLAAALPASDPKGLATVSSRGR